MILAWQPVDRHVAQVGKAFLPQCARELGELMARHDLDEFLLPVLETHHADHLLSVVAEVMARV